MAGATCVGRQLSSSRPNSDWGGSQSLLGTGKGLFLQLMAAAWTARARGRRSAGLGAGPLGQADRWPVAQPESNLGSVGMVGFRPWNFGGVRKQRRLGLFGGVRRRTKCVAKSITAALYACV